MGKEEDGFGRLRNRLSAYMEGLCLYGGGKNNFVNGSIDWSSVQLPRLDSRRVFVTGSEGFIGSHLCEALLAAGAEVMGYDHAPSASGSRPWKSTQGDVRDYLTLESTLRRFRADSVVHLAARTDLTGKLPEDYSSNIAGVRVLGEVMAAVGNVSEAIVASSMLVCRPGYTPDSEFDHAPHTVYGQSKVQTELIWREIGPRAAARSVILRPTSIWGPRWGRHYLAFLNAIWRRRYVQPGWRPLRKTYGFVGNTVFQMISLMSTRLGPLSGKVTYIADYDPLDIRRWAAAFAKAMGVSKPISIPVTALRGVGRAGDLAMSLGISSPISTYTVRNILTEYIFDLSLMRAAVPSLPFDIGLGVELTAEWALAELR